MATLDDKILGEKNHYYCSSSEGESEDECDADTSIKTVTNVNPAESMSTNEWGGLSRNTGPKGVIEDWQKYMQLRREQLEESSQQQKEICTKNSLTCKLDNEVEDEESANFLLEYRKQRMQEMMSYYGNKKTSFGILVDIHSSNDFLQMVDDEKETTTIIVHVYDQSNPACKKINEYLVTLANQYKSVKFCKVLTTSAGLSLSFKISGVPAFLVYKNKQIIGNYIRVTDELGDEFSEGDIENFFIENSILNN